MPRLKLDPTAPFGVSVAEPPVRSIPQQNGYVAKIQLLNELQDVNITGTPDDDQSLAYDTATGKWIPQTISGGGGATNLGATLSATNTIITSDTGTDATIPATDATNAGVMIPAQKTKLDGIATGATANSSDADLLARANHTGTQTAGTISDFSAAADARISNAAGTSIASLSGGKVPTSQLPAVSLTSVQTAVSEVAQLALTTEEGDVVVRTDENKTYMKNAGTAGTMADFTLLNTPTAAVTSVNGETGVVVIDKADVGLGSADNTSDANKPISTATQTALDAKQPLDSDLTTIAGLTATTDNFMVAASSAWASRTPAQAKTSLALVKGDVGLGNVDNTSDASKPVSTATQTALDLKANLASPTFTGTPAAPTAAAGTNTTQLATTAHVLAERTNMAVLTNKDLTSATNTFPNGLVVQVVTGNFAAVATGTTTIPLDDTIPQNTEGTEFMTVSITPKATTNILVIQAVFLVSFSTASTHLIGALFQDTTANALATTVGFGQVGTEIMKLSLVHTVTAGTTSATTFKLRAGGGAAGTMTFNGQSGARLFGTAVKSTMTVHEIKA